jgi:hypothetical protein
MRLAINFEFFDDEQLQLFIDGWVVQNSFNQQ